MVQNYFSLIAKKLWWRILYLNKHNGKGNKNIPNSNYLYSATFFPTL